MAKDPGLSADTCIFMESTSGDGGLHNANVWWLSPDIVLTGPVSGADKADPGQINSVDITIRRKTDESNCLFPGDEQLQAELWVGNPAIAMTPNNNASTKRIMQIGSPVPTSQSDNRHSISTGRHPPAFRPPIHKVRGTSV